MAEKKSWRDYSKSYSDEKTSDKATNNKKTGTWRDYTSDKSTESGRTSGGWRDYSTLDAKSIVGNNIVSRVNSLLAVHNFHLSNYEKRYSGRKYTYEDDYVSDSASWLDTVTKQKSDFDASADEILSYLDQNKDYIDPTWAKDIRNALSKSRDQQSQLLDIATQDNEYWSKFKPSEYQQTVGYTNEKVYTEWQNGIKQYESDLAFDVQAAESELAGLKKEREAYRAEREEARKKAQEDESVWDKIGRWLGTTPDTSLPVYSTQSNATNKTKYDSQISALEERIQRAKYLQELNALSAVSGNKDFAEKSQYVSNVKYSLGGKPEFTDNTYAYINNPTVEDRRPLGAGDITARELIETEDAIYKSDSPIRNLDSSYVQDALDQMTKDEVAIYNYYYATEGKEKADAYLELLINTLKDRKYAEAYEDAYMFGNKHPVWSSISSVAFSLGSASEYLGDVVRYGADYLTGKDAKLDKNELAMTTNAIRGAVTDKVDWEIGNWDAFDFVYNTTMSGADSLASGLMFGNAAGTVLGLSAASQATNDALDRGMSDGQAFWNGLFSGVFEGLFETISIGNFNALKEVAPNGIKDIIKNLGKSMLVNASEETLTEIANIAYDTLVNGEFANYTLEELKNGAWKQALAQVIEAGASGALMGIGMSFLGSSIGNAKANKQAVLDYGNKTDALIQEGLANDIDSKSYQLATKYQQRVEGKDGKKGKALTGQQIRNLLAANQKQVTANDMKKIKQAAEKRLTDLGQTEDVAKIAELATKYVTGQELTRDEKSFLAKSKYGSRVVNELTPKNIASGDYTTGWAEEIGTKQVNAGVYNAKAIRNIIETMANGEDTNTYKSLEDRVDNLYTTSESGQATIHESDEAISMDNVEVVSINDDGTMTLKVDGKEVSTDEIDFADDSQAYLYAAVSKIENITPGDAQAIIRGYNPSSGQTVGEYLNGMDEAYTYGYHGYSEADMNAGNFIQKLTSEQAKGAYLLGQAAKKSNKTNKAEAIKKMRTAVESEAEKAKAEGKEVPKAKGMTITYRNGNQAVDFDKAGLKLTTKQKAAPAIAKIMHEMGLGTNFELFASYVNKDGVRVFLDENGVERKAYSGVYRLKDGTIRIDLNAYSGRGLTLNAMAHELTHFIQQWSTEKYDALAEFLVKTYEKTDMSMRDRVVREQARLKNTRGEDVSYNEAYDEVVANAMSKMLDDGKVMDRLNELMAVDMNLAQKLWEGLKKLLNKFFRVYEKESALFHDAADLVELKAEFEQMQKLWAEAFVEASKNFQVNLTASESQTLTEAGIGFDEDTKSVYSLHFSNAYTEQIQVGKKTFDAEAIAQLVSKVTGRSITDARKWVKSEMAIANIVMQNPEFLDFEADNRYEAIKKNSDYPQGTVDLSNLCPKREEFTSMFDMLQKKYPNKLFTAQDVADMRKILSDNDITVACGACFVEDRRQLIGEIADTFIGMWKEAAESGKPLQKTNAAGNKIELQVTKAIAKQYGLTAGTKIMATDTYIPNQYDLTTYEGFKLLEKNHPTIAMAFNRYNNSRGQQSARLIEGRAEYKRQILGWSDAKVRSVNNNGGLRIFSFSDFEVVHLLDLVQVIIDCSAKGVKIQGYTKIPAFAKLVRNTGVKLNRSLIPKGDYGYHMENGKVVLDYDSKEGIDVNDKNFVDESDNPNVGNIVIGINPTQIGAAMLDPFIDYIIPFHSNKAKEILRKLGTGEWVNYKESQHEKDIATGTSSKHNVNIYTEVINKYHPTNKVEFVEAFLKECKRQGKIPRYAEFLNVDENGDYAYREGYHKLLVDFKMFDKDGNILPQGNITPKLDENFMKELLNAEVDRKQNYQFPQEVYDDIDKKFGEQYSSQETDRDGNTMSDRAKEILANAKPKMIGKNEKADIELDTVRELFNELNTDKDVQALADRVFKVAQDDHYGYYGYGSYGEPKSHLRLPMAFVGKNDIPNGVHGQFRKNTIWGDIVFSYEYFMDDGVAPQSKASTILHEVIHAITCSHIESAYRWSQARHGMYADPLALTDFDGVDERIKAGIELIDTFEQVRSAPTKDGKNLYGQLTVYEMVAEMANVEFRNFLKKQNLWNRIVDAIKRIFGIPNTTAYDAVSDALERILMETTNDADAQREKIRARKENNRYSSQETDADNAPTFYSQMGKVVEGMKQEKFGASSVISMLRGRGVKAEEIRWSGIQAFLEGKKSVTKQELLNFINSSMLHIEEEELGETVHYTEEQLARLNELEQENSLLWDEISELWQELINPDSAELFTVSNPRNLIVRRVNNRNLGGTDKGKRLIQLADALEKNDTMIEVVAYEAKMESPTAKWDQYKLDGGENYRELLFRMPGSTYSNNAMQAHWGGDAQGVLAHARIQDFNTFIGKMLFIEEIQSDWHNAGQKGGYRSDLQSMTEEIRTLEAQLESLVQKYVEREKQHENFLSRYWEENLTDEEYKQEWESWFAEGKNYFAQKKELYEKIAKLKLDINSTAPDAPFKSNYHEYVLKRLLRMAAEQGYDSIGWTTADIQSKRWSDDFAEGYHIEYDQEIPKFLKKYGKQWDTTVGKTTLDNGTEVWSMAITDSMQKSVLKEGQALYSGQETDLDSMGNKLSKGQKAYFASSKVRNRNGDLLVVYHGGTVETKFDTSRGGNGATQYGPGAYFTDSEYYAKEYTYYRGGDVKPYYLNIDKLFDDTDMGVTVQMPEWNKLEQILRDNGIEEKFIKRFADGGFAYMSRYLALKSGVKTSDSWEGSEKLNTMLREAGYQGIKGDLNDVHQYVVFDPEQAKYTSNKQPTSNPDLRYSGHETDNISNRDLLANAFESITKSSDEYGVIQEYKGHIKLLNEYEEKLANLNAEIRKMLFDKNVERDSKKLKELQDEAKKTAANINRHDKKLLSLEASEPLRKVIERERKKEAQKTKAHVKELIQNKKDRAEQAEYRQKIRKVIRDLDKILNRGNKKQNVKEDMKGFVSKALELADYLFTDHISNDELIRKGIDADLVTASGKAQLVKETEDILTKLYDEADSLTDEEFTRLDEKRKANEAKMKDLLTAQRNRRLDVPVYNLFNDLVIEYKSLKNSNQDAVKAAYNEEVERLLQTFIGDEDSDRAKALKNMRVADMTTEELWKLYNAYTMVLTTVRDANKFHVKGMNETIEQVVGKVAGDFGSRKIPDKKLAIAVQKLTNKFGWSYEKLYYALDRIGSESFTKLIMNLADSENTVMQDIIEAAAFRDQIVEKYGFNNWAVNKEIDREFMDNSGKKFKMTLGQMMSLYAYSRREGAWDHIEYGGFVFGKAALTNPKPADSYKLSKAQCEAITSLLTKEQKGYVEDMQKFLSETMGSKGNEVSMQLYGVKMFGEKNYFPIHVAGQFKAQAQESQAKQAAGFGSMSNAGFTHAQNPNAKAPFVLEGFNEVWADHVNEMSRYHGTVPALEDIRRVMNRSTYSDSVAESQSIKQLMENHFGKEAVEYFDNLYREANSGAITDKLQKNSKKLLSLFRKNSVAYSLSVLIQQPASLVRAYAMIDKKYFGFHGFGAITSGVAKAVSSKWSSAYSDAYNEMLKYAPGVTMAKEIGGFDTATGGSIRSHLLDTGKSIKQKWNTGTALEKGKAALDVVDNNAIANLPNVADKIAWIEIWNACKRETVAKNKDITPGSEEFMRAVGERFTEVIRATQVYDSIFAKSPMLKSKNLAVQYLVSFMNEPNTVANMVEKAVRDATRGNWKQGVRTGAAVIYSIVFTGVLKSVIYAMRDDDEDETYIEKYIEALVGGMMDDFNALNYIPLVRDAWSVAQGYDVERSDMAIVADALDSLSKVIQNGLKDTDDMTEEQLIEFDKKCTEANWKLVESLAAFFGIPVKNVRREIEGVIDHARIASANAGMTTASSVWDKIQDTIIDSIPFMKAESKIDKLYNAIISGDTAYADRLKATYKTEDAYNSAVRKALRENDSRIHDAAQARYEGKTEEYKRIFREIQGEGIFTFDEIMGAVNSEENAIKNKLEPDKVTSSYSTSDFVQAVSMGDTSTASAIREELISTYIANGKTQAEAEDAFASAISSSTHDAYSSGLLDDTGAKNMLVEYAGMDEEDADSRVSYWAFCNENPEYAKDISESKYNKYIEFAEPVGVSLDVFVQYINGTKGLEEVKDEWGDVVLTKREQVLEVINSLPLTWQQKDALYLAYGYAESKIWDVPW